MMFKKKANIPPRPKPPTSEMLLEDITHNHNCSDCLWAINTEDWISTAAPITSEVATDHEHSYQQAKTFVEINQRLEDMLQKLQVQSEHLQASDVELRNKAEQIREQAINALK